MRAVQFRAFGGPLEVVDVAEPEPPADGAVIRVEATGVCHSDWHGWQGHDPDITVPHVPGHEFAGVVHAVGPLVRRWRGGERVTAPFVCGCGACAMCARGDQQVCDQQTQPGFTHDGSFAEQVLVHHADVNLVALPDGLDPVGAAAGARVVAVDISPAALALAADLGAEVCIDGSELARSATTDHAEGGDVGSHGMAAHTYPPMLAAVRADRLRPERLVTRQVDLDAVPDVLTAIGQPHAQPGITVAQL